MTPTEPSLAALILGRIFVALAASGGLIWLVAARPAVFLPALLIVGYALIFRLTRFPAPPPRARRRLPRFAIRHLMIAVAFASIALALSTWIASAHVADLTRRGFAPHDPASATARFASAIFIGLCVLSCFGWREVTRWRALLTGRREGSIGYRMARAVADRVVRPVEEDETPPPRLPD